MPLPNEEEINQFGPLIPPFGRNTRTDKAKVLNRGEDILYGLDSGAYDATSNGLPENVVLIEKKYFELLIKNCGKYRDDFEEQKYLWVIGTWGLRMILEHTRNTARRPKQYVCHTNLTGGMEAYQGGELWFCEDGRVGINWFSDRYGATSIDQWKTVVSHFKRVNYTNLVELKKMES